MHHASSTCKMEESSIKPDPLPDNVSVRRWFAFYALLLLLMGAPLVVLIAQSPFSWSQWVHETETVFRQTTPAIKLLGFGIYLSICCTFCPLPTGWIVAGVATREAAVAGGISGNVAVVALLTTVTVALVGAIGSTIANLNDYHVMTWMLRHHRIAKLRHTRTYRLSARWFAKSPFFILVLFNIIPIPVDVIRMLATTYRYPRGRFAGANFVGRFIRYAVIAFVTWFFNLGWIAVVALLGVAVLLATHRLAPPIKRLLRPSANRAEEKVSKAMPTQE